RQRALEAKLTRITVVVEAPPEGMVVRIDRSTLRRPAWNVATPINPGPHRLEATAPGYEPFVLDFEIPDHKADQSITVPQLTPLRGSEGSEGASAVQRELAADPAADAGKAQRTTGLALGATGLALVGVGGYFGVRALQLKGDSDDACPNNQCSAEGARLSRDALTSANVANVTIGLGLVAIGLGTYFFLDGNRRAEEVARK